MFFSLQILREIVVRGEHSSLNVCHVPFHVREDVGLLQSVSWILIEKVLMPRQYMLHQAVFVTRSVRAERALELWIDPALEIVMPLQMVFMLVSFPAGGASVLEHRYDRMVLGLVG